MRPKFARAANPSSPSQPNDAVLLYKLLQKVWELSPTSRIAFAFWCPQAPNSRGHHFPISIHLFHLHLYSSGNRGCEPWPHTTSPCAALADVVSAHLGISHLLHIRLICSNGTEILKFQTCKKPPKIFTHGGCSLLRKSCSKLASWSAGTQSKERSLSTDALNSEFNAAWIYKTLLCPKTGCCLHFQSASRKMRELSWVCCM